MAFLVEDFEDFLRILADHPEWQQRLRKILVDEFLEDIRRVVEAELAPVWAAVREVSRGQNEMRAELISASEVQNEMRAELGSLSLAQEETRSELRALTTESREHAHKTDGRLDTLEGDMKSVKNDLGQLKGYVTETWYRDRATGIFGHLLDSPRVVAFSAVPQVKNARKTGALSVSEWNELQRLDLVVEGLSDDDNLQTCIALEISISPDDDDLDRVRRRAELMRRVGVRTVAAVAGRNISPVLVEHAKALGVGVLEEGVAVFWPESVAV